MPRSSWLVLCLALLLVIVLAACSPPLVPDPSSTSQQNGQEAASGLPPLSVPEAEPEDKFEVHAWVDKPIPVQGEQITLFGNLRKNGVILGGMMMEANWPDENQERGRPNCYVLVIYQGGVCVIDTKGYPIGEYVPLVVKFVYDGQTFTGETGFTPK